MSGQCCAGACGSAATLKDRRWRRVLWIALALNAAMFMLEISASLAADSRALQADALDFLGDAANYAVSLGVAGMALAWRARAALLKGATILLFGIGVLASAFWAFATGTTPEPAIMGAIGLSALATNVVVALMLFHYRTGDANMRSVWICSRNDAIGNVAVMLAALGVFGTVSALPDLIVAVGIAALAISGGWQIIWAARGELSPSRQHFAEGKVVDALGLEPSITVV